MTKYEHMLINSRELIRRQQNGDSLGAQGWRVVGVAYNDLLVLEREVR